MPKQIVALKALSCHKHNKYPTSTSEPHTTEDTINSFPSPLGPLLNCLARARRVLTFSPRAKVTT